MEILSALRLNSFQKNITHKGDRIWQKSVVGLAFSLAH